MSGRTTRFGLSIFGAGIPGNITEDGGKYSSLDRQVIDRVLNSLEIHNHSGGARLMDPDAAPLLSLDSTTGALAAGTTFFYRVSFVDQFGLETAASAEMSITTPAPISPPGAPSMTGAALGGGDDNPGVRTGITYYALTAIASGNETNLGDPGIITVFADAPSITVNFPSLQDGVTQYGVWRKGPNEAGYTRIATVTAVDDGTYVDEGQVSPATNPLDPSIQPNAINLTNSTNTVTVTTPDVATVTADPSEVKRWRIYRSRTSGVYSSTSLLADVVTTVNPDGTGGLLSTFLDDGSVTPSTGAPLNISQTLTPSPLLGAQFYNSVGDLPDTANLPEGAEVVVLTPGVGTYRVISGSWVQTSGISSSLYLQSAEGKNFLLGVEEDGTLYTELLVPTTPTSVVATASATVSGEIDLAWDFTPAPYAKPVTNYTITATPTGDAALTPVTTTDASTVYSYTGLTPAQAYTFTVIANSSEGASAASAASNSATAPA